MWFIDGTFSFVTFGAEIILIISTAMQSDELGSLHNELISFQLNFIVNLDQPNIQIIKCNLNVTHIEFI